MDPLRLVLFGGLVLHKIIWEVYKIGTPKTTKGARPGLAAFAFKAIKLVVLAFLLVQTLFLDILPITDTPFGLTRIGFVVYCAGLAIAIAGRVQLGKNWANLEDAQVHGQQALVHSGIYRYVRHPIYVGDSLLLVGLELALNSWLVLATIIPIAVFVRQALAEEKMLARSFDGYAAYQAQTKRFIPFVY
ncbi:MAG: isoprenylcysteine carboxylmethyltransferase family protein [Anaerolineae bacterium]|nr:isoprenylcysteine carboxylmethyltransferase family protein [Anaerolineae bacterium]